MIPMGNWADRIDGLESENYDLAEAVNTLEDEIAELLFQLDEMRDIVSSTVNARVTAQEELEKLRTEYADAIEELGFEFRRAETAEAELALYAAETWTDHDGTIRPIVATRAELARRLYDENERAGLERARASKAERDFRDYKIVHPENERLLDYWRERAQDTESRYEVVCKDLAHMKTRAEKAHALLARIRTAGGLPQGATGDDIVNLVVNRDYYLRERNEARDRAETAEADRDNHAWHRERERLLAAELGKALDEARARAASHWESAKTFARAMDSWREETGKWVDRYHRIGSELHELKKALLVLGGDR